MVNSWSREPPVERVLYVPGQLSHCQHEATIIRPDPHAMESLGLAARGESSSRCFASVTESGQAGKKDLGSARPSSASISHNHVSWRHHHAKSHASSEPRAADGAATGAGCAGRGARVCQDRSTTDHRGGATARAVSDLCLAARLSSLDRCRVCVGARRMGAPALRSRGLGVGPVGARAPRVLLAVGTLAAWLEWLVHHEDTKTRRIFKVFVTFVVS